MMFRRFLILLFVLIGIIAGFTLIIRPGYSPRPIRNFTIQIDTSFTARESRAIISAATRWEMATKKHVRFSFERKSEPDNFDPLLDFLTSDYNKDITANRTIFLWKGTSRSKKLEELETALTFKVVGFTPGNYMLLVPGRLETDQDLERIALHEFGHLIGLAHTASIMSTDDSQTSCIMKVDLLQYCERYHCSLDHDVVIETCDQ